MFDLMSRRPSTRVQLSSFVYREMISPSKGTTGTPVLWPCSYRAGLPHAAGPLLQQQYRDVKNAAAQVYGYTHT